MAIYRNPVAIARARQRATKGVTASINGAAAITCTLGSGKNEGGVQGHFVIERDRQDVLIAAADYGRVPEIGDVIIVTLPDARKRRLAVYVPENSNQCYQESDAEGTEYRVFTKEEGVAP